MGSTADLDKARRPLSEAPIAADAFALMREENLARWPTGMEIDLDEAVAFHRSLPIHKQLAKVMRQADSEGRCLTQPRGGVATLAMQQELMEKLEREGLADIIPTTTDSYTRNERFSMAQSGVDESLREGRSMLNGFPMVNYGPKAARQLIESINKPGIVLSGTAMPKLIAEIGYAAGYSGFLGSGIAYTTSYTKELSIEEGIRNYQYVDRLAALYQEKGVELHRRQPGFLTGTNIPPCIAIAVCILDALLAAGQGVKNYGLELGQTLHLIQDAVAIDVCRTMCQEYLALKGYRDVFTPVSSLQWMGAWPYDDAQSAALVAFGGTLAAVSGAISVTTKTLHEAFGIPTAEANVEGLRITRMAIYLARHISLKDLPEYQREKELLIREVRVIVDKVLEMGDGDAAVGSDRAFEAGVLDIPWSPNRHVKGRVMPARDAQGYLRILDPASMPFTREIMEVHEAGLRQGVKLGDYGLNLAVQSVSELSEPLEKLLDGGRARVPDV